MREGFSQDRIFGLAQIDVSSDQIAFRVLGIHQSNMSSLFIASASAENIRKTTFEIEMVYGDIGDDVEMSYFAFQKFREVILKTGTSKVFPLQSFFILSFPSCQLFFVKRSIARRIRGAMLG